MKRMIFSDVHLHPWKYGSTTLENGYNSRLWAQKEALSLVLQACIDEEIQYAYFGGDLFHTPGVIPTQALAVAQEFMVSMAAHNITLRMLVGNHDMGNRTGTIHALGENAVSPGTWQTWNDGGILVHGLGYTDSEDTLRRFLDYAAVHGGILLMHQGVAGVPLSSGYILDEKLSHDLIPDSCVAFTGHYHIHSPVSERLTVIGNLTALNWNDLDQSKGYIIYDDETGEMKQHSALAPEFMSIKKTSMSVSEVRGNFVRFIDPVLTEDVEKIRNNFLELGVLTVEFPNIVDETNKTVLVSEGRVFNPTTYITELEDGMDLRRIEVGEQTREMNYA